MILLVSWSLLVCEAWRVCIFVKQKYKHNPLVSWSLLGYLDTLVYSMRSIILYKFGCYEFMFFLRLLRKF